jgi:hypothetical protein
MFEGRHSLSQVEHAMEEDRQHRDRDGAYAPHDLTRYGEGKAGGEKHRFKIELYVEVIDDDKWDNWSDEGLSGGPNQHHRQLERHDTHRQEDDGRAGDEGDSPRVQRTSSRLPNT